MKQKVLIIGAVLLAFTAILLTAAILFRPNSEPKSVDLTLEKSQEIYANALETLIDAQDKVLQVNSTEEILVNGSVFTEKLERTEIYNSIGSSSAAIRIDEQMQNGTHIITNTELYSSDKVYLTINGSNFTANCSESDFYQRLTPLMLIDSALYNEISGQDTGSEYIITFASPILAENWLNISENKLQAATGTVRISYKGDLISSTYTTTYMSGNITVTKQLSVTPQLIRSEIALPSDTTQYTPISYIDGPRTLERVSGFLTQAECISSEYTDSIYFGALGDCREQTIVLHAYKDSQLSAHVKTDIVLSGEGFDNQQTIHTKLEEYTDKIYSVQLDDGAQTNHSNITEDLILEYLQNLLLSTIMLPEYIASAEMSETDTTIHIQYTGTEAFAAFLRENAGTLLYQDPTILNNADTSVNTTKLVCHLTINRQTGLPLSTGIQYTATYTVEGLPYQMHYHAEQTYTLADSRTIAAMNKAAGN